MKQKLKSSSNYFLDNLFIIVKNSPFNIKSFLFRFLFISLIFSFPLTIFSCDKKEVYETTKKEILTPIVAYAKVDKVKGTIGDTITYELNIDQAKEIKADIVDPKKVLKDFEITQEEKQPETEIDNRLTKKFIYKFQIKNVGTYSIEPIEIKYKVPENLQSKYGKDGSVKTSKIYLDIQSTLKPEDKNKEIEDIKPLEEINVIDAPKMIMIIIVVLIFIYLIYLFFKKIFAPAKPLLAHEIAFKELDKIKEKDLKNEDLKAFYFHISEVIRTYLKNRFAINALEKDYSELKQELNSNTEITKENDLFIEQFIESTDFYKFTDYKPEKDQALKLFESAYNFVDITKKLPEKKKK